MVSQLKLLALQKFVPPLILRLFSHLSNTSPLGYESTRQIGGEINSLALCFERFSLELLGFKHPEDSLSEHGYIVNYNLPHNAQV